MVRIITLLISLGCLPIPSAFADTYPEVLFENSPVGGNYAYSRVHYEGGSWVENVAGSLPVSDSVFFTPGNALALHYTSKRGGDWRVRLAYPQSSGRYSPKAGDLLVFKLFVASDSERDQLPRLALRRGDTVSMPIDIGSYLSDFQVNMWIDVHLPLSDIRGLSVGAGIDGVEFSQGSADDGAHALYLDQVEFLPASPPRVKLSSPAVLSVAKAYERHVDLTWQLPLTPSIRYIKIYRSEDNEHFAPVAIRPIFVQKCTDVVPFTNKTYYYKVAWVDYDYLESPFSNVIKAETRPVSDDAFLDFMQAAHFNYFVERTEVNSGMHGVRFGVDDATVSVSETGFSILSHVVGVARGFISRAVAVSRLERTLDFLEKVERYQGAFPAYIDGRTGKGIFAVDTVPEGDLRATAALMQGLLVAQRYFQADSGQQDPLSDRIGMFWKSVVWNDFVVEGQEHILMDRWSPTVGFRNARPMGGFGTDFVGYVLALAAPLYPLDSSAYRDGLGVRRELVDSVGVMELANNASFSVKVADNPEATLPRYVELPYVTDTVAYGLPITVGSLSASLQEAYLPFLAFDPRHKRDAFADYYANNVNLTNAYRRRDNEAGYGGFLRDVWGAETLRIGADTVHVINPSIACASYGYLPEEALSAMRALYDHHGQALFTEYGFRRWIALGRNQVADAHDALHQAAAIVMIENGRSGLVWDLLSGHPDIKKVVANHFTVE